MYIIQDKQGGNPIDRFSTLQEAEKMLEQYEEQDRIDGVYTEDFYEIVEEN